MSNLLVCCYLLAYFDLLTCYLQAEIEQLRVRGGDQLRALDELQTDYNG